MNEQEKSLKLAELMGWDVQCKSALIPTVADYAGGSGICILQPYSDNHHGLAQFASILLKFPEVMERFTRTCTDTWTHAPIKSKLIIEFKPTQANILDEILRSKGIDPDA